MISNKFKEDNYFIKVLKIFGIIVIFAAIATTTVFVLKPKNLYTPSAASSDSFYALSWSRDCSSKKVKYTKTLVNGQEVIKTQCVQTDGVQVWTKNCKGYVDSKTSAVNQNNHHTTCYEPVSSSSVQPSYSYVPDWNYWCETSTEVTMTKPYIFSAKCMSKNLGWTRLCNGFIRTSKQGSGTESAPTGSSLNELCLKIEN